MDPFQAYCFPTAPFPDKFRPFIGNTCRQQLHDDLGQIAVSLDQTPTEALQGWCQGSWNVNGENAQSIFKF